MTHKYKFPIGDWSNDGHGKCDWFVAQGEKPVQDLREAHFKCKEVLGFNIGDICGEYEEFSIKEEILEKLYAAEIIERNGEFEGITKELFELWLKILNHIDPELKLVPIENILPNINFYGHDEKKRHLGTPGYGLHS